MVTKEENILFNAQQPEFKGKDLKLKILPCCGIFAPLWSGMRQELMPGKYLASAKFRVRCLGMHIHLQRLMQYKPFWWSWFSPSRRQEYDHPQKATWGNPDWSLGGSFASSVQKYKLKGAQVKDYQRNGEFIFESESWVCLTEFSKAGAERCDWALVRANWDETAWHLWWQQIEFKWSFAALFSYIHLFSWWN